MNTENEDDFIPLSGDPLFPNGVSDPLFGPPVAVEEKALRRGRGGMLVALIGIPVLLLVAAVGYILATGGDGQYRTLATNLNTLKQAHFDAFWQCSFEGVDLRSLNNQQLVEELHRRGRDARGKAWVAHVRDRCEAHLAPLEPKLRALIPPDDLREDVDALEDATQRLRADLVGFIAYVEGAQTYDESAVHDRLQRIARAWYDFRNTHNEIKRAVRVRLEGE